MTEFENEVAAKSVAECVQPTSYLSDEETRIEASAEAEPVTGMMIETETRDASVDCAVEDANCGDIGSPSSRCSITPMIENVHQPLENGIGIDTDLMEPIPAENVSSIIDLDDEGENLPPPIDDDRDEQQIGKLCEVALNTNAIEKDIEDERLSNQFNKVSHIQLTLQSIREGNEMLKKLLSQMESINGLLQTQSS